MICKCGEDGIYNEANGKGFYYCRTCKCEIELEEVKREEFVPVQTIQTFTYTSGEMDVDIGRMLDDLTKGVL